MGILNKVMKETLSYSVCFSESIFVDLLIWVQYYVLLSSSGRSVAAAAAAADN